MNGAGRTVRTGVATAAVGLVLAGCGSASAPTDVSGNGPAAVGSDSTRPPSTGTSPTSPSTSPSTAPSSPRPSSGATEASSTGTAGLHRTVTLAFAGDMHFEAHLAALLDHPADALGPISTTLAGADLTMANLETAITGRGTPEAKEIEVPSQRFHFRTSPAALDVLDAAGVDVATMANNHGADYGPVGLRDSLRAIRKGPIAVVGIGRNRRAAFTPYVTSARGTDFAFLAGDASMREGSSTVWEAGPHNPGLAAAHADRPRALIAAVRAAARRADVVVVYLHWGEELVGCPTHQQRATATALARAGADVIVGSHAHVQLGSGWLGDTYVDYGLGNFLWYHDHQPLSGVLQVRIRDGAAVADGWVPAVIGADGRPAPLHGAARARAIADWRRLRACTGLAARPQLEGSSPTHPGLPSYTSSVRPVGAGLRHRMRFSHRAGCPVGWEDLRYLRMRYVGFDGRAHLGEMVVHREQAAAVTQAFRRLYDARWPIRRMDLVDDYRGDDHRSMAANNTSGFNCRRVAGSDVWSAHAYGTAVDINPLQNPDLHAGIDPPAGRQYAALDRSAGARLPRGVIGEDGVVVEAFAGIGWSWGGTWATAKDYQHFTAG